MFQWQNLSRDHSPDHLPFTIYYLPWWLNELEQKTKQFFFKYKKFVLCERQIFIRGQDFLSITKKWWTPLGHYLIMLTSESISVKFWPPKKGSKWALQSIWVLRTPLTLIGLIETTFSLFTSNAHIIAFH